MIEAIIPNAFLAETPTTTEQENVKVIKTDMFKKQLNRWLRDLPKSPRIENDRASVNSETNSITKQKKNIW